MIDVGAVLDAMPAFTGFVSVESRRALAEDLRGVAGFTVEIAGHSVNGLPIHHIKVGEGPVKALLVAGPHCMEPIGSLTVTAILTLLRAQHPALAGVEWHIVPCIDPDGALLNEGWSQHPFTLTNYMRNYHLQAPDAQVDTSFPLGGGMTGPPLSREAAVLKSVLDAVRPDFYYPIHNAWAGGAFYFISRDLGVSTYDAIYSLLQNEKFPVQRRPIWREICTEFSTGFVEIFSMQKYYAHLAATGRPLKGSPQFGAGSWDYLSEIKPGALTFVSEMGYVRHPRDESEKRTGRTVRPLLLKLDANNKYLASLICDVWEELGPELNTASPFHRVMTGGMICPPRTDLIYGGPPLSRYPTADIFARDDIEMTDGELFTACITDGGFQFLPVGYQFVRLLKDSPRTPTVARAIETLDAAFDRALDGIAREIDFAAFSTVDYNTLARVQVGSGLIALNSVIARS